MLQQNSSSLNIHQRMFILFIVIFSFVTSNGFFLTTTTSVVVNAMRNKNDYTDDVNDEIIDLKIDVNNHSLSYSLKYGNFVLNSDSSINDNSIIWNGFRYNNEMYRIGHHDSKLALTLIDKSIEIGQDMIGNYQRMKFRWTTIDNVHFETNFRNYQYDNKNKNNHPVVVFEQVFINGTKNAAVLSHNDNDDDDDDISGMGSSFPCFALNDTSLQGYAFLNVYGNMMCGGHELNTQDAKNITGNYCNCFSSVSQEQLMDNNKEKNDNNVPLQMQTGLKGGEIFTIFDESFDTTVIISPLTNFMSTNMNFKKKTNTIHYGTHMENDELPAFYTVETVMVLEKRGGINNAFASWGNIMKSRYKSTVDMKQIKDDMSINYLTYYTDNGAYYYYKTEKDANYEGTLLRLWEHIKEEKIPFRSLQLDSWWYFKPSDSTISKDHGVSLWEERADIFPNGLEAFQNKINVPIIAHNRYWSTKNLYAKENGGNYDFHMDKNLAVPLEEKFWDDLFAKAKKWGLDVYEQDWLYSELEGVDLLKSSPTLARQWLLQMDRAARKHNIKIQYCMPYVKHVLQSLETTQVTQIRVTDDYDVRDAKDRRQQWGIGDTSLIANALGFAPFKDVFWTSTHQPDSIYENAVEYAPALQTLVATLSTGPVAVGDKIGYLNRRLIMRSCNDDGLILKPSTAATTVDASFLKRAFNKSGPEGVVSATYTNIAAWSWDIVVAGVLRNSWKATPKDLQSFTAFDKSRRIAYKIHRDAKMDNVKEIQIFDDEHPIVLSPCNQTNYENWFTAPVFENGIVLLGEINKWVPISPQRITTISATFDDSRKVTGGVKVEVSGAPNENVEFSFAQIDDLTKIVSKSIQLSELGRGNLFLHSEAIKKTY